MNDQAKRRIQQAMIEAEGATVVGFEAARKHEKVIVRYRDRLKAFSLSTSGPGHKRAMHVARNQLRQWMRAVEAETPNARLGLRVSG